ncbi:hypothetical protein OW909_25940 [Klebsiella pneumoniae]|nr:hypothetical protein [Klebsiella pneumoniae]HBT3263133.1 hypothetical protein [Klebsiella pneumoniae]
MTKILIVDDEYLKPRAISELAYKLDSEIDIQHATTARDARIKMRDVQYDLLLIDIDLPEAMGASPIPLGGMSLFDMFTLDPMSKTPLDIVFITEKEDSIDLYNFESAKRGTSLCKFDSQNDTWKLFITGKLNLIINRRRVSLITTPNADIAIITALGYPELDAVLKLPYNWQRKRFSDDPTGYNFGVKNTNGVKLNVVAASSMRKGMSSSSALAMKMVERFKPKVLVMLGICAGVQGKVNIGDVIIADPTWDWGSGKMSQDNNGTSIFLSAPHQLGLEPHIAQIAMEMTFESALSQKIQRGWKGKLPTDTLSIHVGPLASGSMVLAADKSIETITTQNRDLIGVDMEAYAVMAASEYARKKKPISIVIKSVSDFADSTKEDNWQEYASYTCANFFDALISNVFFTSTIQ